MPKKFTPAEDAIQFRSISFGVDEWRHVKGNAHRRGLAVRRFVAAAVEAELAPLLASLGAAQSKVQRKQRRLPVDDRVLRQLSAGRKQAGIPAVALLRICLAKHSARDLGRPGNALDASADVTVATR